MEAVIGSESELQSLSRLSRVYIAQQVFDAAAPVYMTIYSLIVYVARDVSLFGCFRQNVSSLTLDISIRTLMLITFGATNTFVAV